MKKQKGLILIFTGNGKGKTTAAFGAALRMIGHGKKVAIVQFLKSDSGECKAARMLGSRLKVWSFGGGFTWQVSRAENQKAVSHAWKKCVQLLRDPQFSLVILDEIHIALQHRFLKVEDVIKAIKTRRAGQHVILTGRHAPAALIRIADLVTEMKCVKHPFQKGAPAQRGIEF